MKKHLSGFYWLTLATLSACAFLALSMPTAAQKETSKVAETPTPVPSQPAAEETATADQWLLKLTAWRTQRESDLDAPDGWLSLIGLEWLTNGVNTVGTSLDSTLRIGAPGPQHIGLLTVTGAGPKEQIVQFSPPPGGFPDELMINGTPAHPGPLSVNDKTPSTITWRSLTLTVLERGGRFVLRIKDANSPTRLSFHGLNWYAPDPDYYITAAWIPYNPPHIEDIPTIIGTTLKLPAPGIVEFDFKGKLIRLEPVVEDPSGKTLFFILRDTTSKTTTYESARFLHTGLPDHGLDKPGLLDLDFNRLENPPCAYTPYATCPLPPELNRLTIAIDAGEKRFTP